MGNTKVMEERKERVDVALRYIAFGYPALFTIIYLLNVIDPFGLGSMNSVVDIGYYLFSQEPLYFSVNGEPPLVTILVTAILFGIRWVAYGKTYQK